MTLSRHNQIPQSQTTGVVASWLFELIDQENLSLQEASQTLEIPESSFTSGNGYLRLKPFNALFEWVAEKLDDELLGVHLAEQAGVSKLGVLGYLIQNCATLQDALQLGERYLAIMQQDATVSYSVINNICHCRYQVSGIDIPSIRQDAEFTLATMILFNRKQLGEGWTPIETFFTHSAPKDGTTHQALFGNKIHYDASFNGFDIDAELLSTPINGSDPQLLSILQHQADQLLSQIVNRSDVINHVRLLIMSSISRKSFGINEAAQELFMSRRTLLRRLNAAGTTYQRLRNEVLIEVAKEALTENTASITDIALQLGYSENSAFVRAFRRLTGITPLQYRKTHQNITH
jgi:AraC-like DNA-binding protein